MKTFIYIFLISDCKMETRAKKSRREEIVESWNPNHPVTIHKLNDDCLTNIFTFLRIVDKVRIERGN